MKADGAQIGNEQFSRLIQSTRSMNTRKLRQRTCQVLREGLSTSASVYMQMSRQFSQGFFFVTTSFAFPLKIRKLFATGCKGKHRNLHDEIENPYLIIQIQLEFVWFKEINLTCSLKRQNKKDTRHWLNSISSETQFDVTKEKMGLFDQGFGGFGG